MSKNIDKDFSYPEPNDPDFLSKIFKKREYYIHRVPKRDMMKTYEDVQEYRAQNCKDGDIDPREQQYILPNFISPATPYKGVLLMHGVGSGKTATAIRIAEQFKDQVKKYNTKIYVVVPGPNTKENVKKEFIVATGDTYIKNKEELEQMNKEEVEHEKGQAVMNALQYYKILSYKTFYRKVLGEKIAEKKIVNNTKIKTSYRKTAEGEYEREIVLDKIQNMDNSILIIDEAHNMATNDNSYGDALREIIKKSENLRIILLTATPMINLADEIVNLLNFIRPKDDMIERDKIFTSDKNYKLSIKPGGLEYLKNKARGYVSFYRGSIPYTFATRVDKGELPEGMLFTPVVKCFMEDFQYKYYMESTKNVDDTLEKGATAAANFVFPIMNNEGTDIIGGYSTEGVTKLLSQLLTNGNKLRKLINKSLFKGKLNETEEKFFIYEGDDKKITGKFLELQYLKQFSIKYYRLIRRLEKLVDGYKGSGTAFIYSNLVKAGGIELFAETLIQNGYLEYKEDSIYNIKDNTIDYKTGLEYNEFKKKHNINDFKPAVFIMVTGGTEEGAEDIPEIKQKIVREVFNSIDNVDGKHIKFLLGSRVMNEGVTLKNVRETHIIDSFYNIPKMEQVIGRAIRMCVHKDSINDNNKFPKVYIYRYVVAINDRDKNELSVDETLYQKAEIKYLTVKEIERALKEIALDCPLLLHANVFPEELDKYKDCVYPTLENVKAGKTICPALCDFRKCDLKCDEKGLNNKYWDDKNRTYKKLKEDEIDYNTFNDDLAKDEIKIVKNKIKDLYRFKHVYVYDEIFNMIQKSLTEEQTKLFDNYFLDQALDDMMPKDENDFNQFNDMVYDKYNRPGYLIQRSKYYIFQPFNENENVSMHYREHIDINHTNMISVDNYINEYFGNIISPSITETENTEDITGESEKDETLYDLEYYKEREENYLVGIIDKDNVFKVREPLLKNTNKKRGVGMPTITGAVCANAKTKEYLIKMVERMPYIDKKEIKRIEELTRDEICDEIKLKLLFLEKYSTTKDNNKLTYVMVPKKLPSYPFPYNLEDRIKYIKNKIMEISDNHNIVITTRNIKNGEFMGEKDKEYPNYEISFKDSKYFKNKEKELESIGFKLLKDKWIMVLS